MSVLASDNFNRANAGTLGANWTLMKGNSEQFKVLSNQAAVATVSSRDGSYYSATAFPNNQYSQALVVTLGNAYSGVAVRAITSGATRNAYYAGVEPNDFGGATTTRIWKDVASVVTSLGTGATAAAAGQTHYLEAQGTVLVMKVNGTNEISVTDASLTAGQPGIAAFHNSTAVGIFDDWVGGDFAATNRILYPRVLDGLGPYFRGLS